MIIKSTGEDAYFAASNSAKGFFSYYKECFDTPRIRHLYAIKGGPGTGKSRFMREVAECGEGAGWQCEYIYCSSDPDSLDGLFVAIGHAPENQAFANVTTLNEWGYIVSDERCLTDTDGIFVAGDCRTKSIRQITTATADGAVAALAACRYLDSI